MSTQKVWYTSVQKKWGPTEITFKSSWESTKNQQSCNIQECSSVFSAELGKGQHSLVPRPSHCPVFDYAKNGEGRRGPFYYVNDINVYLGRQRGEGSLIKDAFHACILRFEPRVICLLLCERLKLQCLGQKLQDQTSSSIGDPPPLCRH